MSGLQLAWMLPPSGRLRCLDHRHREQGQRHASGHLQVVRTPLGGATSPLSLCHLLLLSLQHHLISVVGSAAPQQQLPRPTVRLYADYREQHQLALRPLQTAEMAAASPILEPAPVRLSSMTVPCPFCSALRFIEERRTISSKTNPVFGSCCLSGKISLPVSVPPPEPLRALLDDLTPQAKEFRNHARAYNAALQMASSGIKVDERFSTGIAFFPGVMLVCHLRGDLPSGMGKDSLIHFAFIR